MAGGDAEFSSSTTSMTLFLSLLLAFHFAMAVPEHSFSTLTSTKDAVKKRNTMVAAASAREGSAQNSKRDVTPNETTNGIHVPDQPQQGSKRRNSRDPRPQLRSRNKMFNAGEHEVPSGPNPISNRIGLEFKGFKACSLI